MIPVLMAFKAIFAPAKIIGLVTSTVKFLIEHWKECLFAGMAFTIFHQNFMEWEMLKWVGVRTIPGIEQELVVKQEQLDECELSRANLKGQIDSTNAQVEKWADVSSQLQRQHDKLVEEITDMREKSRKAVEDILSEPTPKTCEAAIQYLRDAKEDLRWPGME